MRLKRLTIFGAGGHAKVLIDVALCQAVYEPAAIFDETGTAKGKLLGVDIIENREHLKPGFFIVGVGDNKSRKRIFDSLLAEGWEAATLIHPLAAVSRSASIGSGSVICRLASLCVESVVEQNVIINSSATVGHESLVESHAHVSAGCHLGGRTIIRNGALMGVASCTRPRIEVGSWSIVGAGSAVVGDVPAGLTVAGCPARDLYKR